MWTKLYISDKIAQSDNLDNLRQNQTETIRTKLYISDKLDNSVKIRQSGQNWTIQTFIFSLVRKNTEKV